MSIEAEIYGNAGKGPRRRVHVHPFKTSTGMHSGIVVLSHPFRGFSPSVRPFLNDTVGTAMNQNVSFGTAAVTIHNGGTSANGDSGTADTDTPNHIIQSGQNFDTTVVVGSYATATNTGHVTAVAAADLTCDADICPNGNEAFTIDPVWTGSSVQGTWDFNAASDKITLTSANNNDSATFDAASTAAYDWENFTAFTGKVDLDTFDAANHTIVVGFTLDGILVGNTVNLNGFIDTSNFSEQSFVITKAALGLTDGDTVNSLVVTLLRSGGAKPTFKLDDLQMEGSGTPLVFSATTPLGTVFYVTEIRVELADDVTGIITGSTTTYPTMTGLAYDALLGVSALTNGVLFQSVQNGKVIFSITLKQLGDFFGVGLIPDSAISDGTNTFISMRIEFPQPIRLDGTKGDSLSFTISDNLSGLLEFKARVRGALEV